MRGEPAVEGRAVSVSELEESGGWVSRCSFTLRWRVLGWPGVTWRVLSWAVPRRAVLRWVVPGWGVPEWAVLR
ncbi:hypothetical protein GCM10009804_39170 [Kribbella hippodromi]|uniref:Uncharacterized protein n=1 Tax=Kribbella hippodromi TaxID=434347 RepID=A0ABN2DKG3_9ACTN